MCSLCWSPARLDTNELSQPETAWMQSEAILPDPALVMVLIVGVRGIPHAEWFPGADRFLYCSIRRTGEEQELFRTERLKNVVDPVWMQETGLLLLLRRDCQKRDVNAKEETFLAAWLGDELEFSIWEDDDRNTVGSTGFLGKATLHSSQFESRGFNGELLVKIDGMHTGAYLKIKVRMCGQSFPHADALEEFEATIANPKKKKMLGLGYDQQDGSTLYVHSVKANGPVNTYNQATDPSKQLTPGSFVVQINDVKGDSALLAKELQKKTDNVRLVVRRPMTVRIPLHKSDGFGVVLAKKPTGTSLLITKVEEGPVQDWNKENPMQEVKPGDRIVAVNGKCGHAKDLRNGLIASLRAEGCQLTIVRPADVVEKVDWI